MNTTKEVSFKVNDIDGNLLPGIIHCFLASILIDTANPPAIIRAKDGNRYQAVYDNFTFPAIGENPITKAIVSFQQHEDGNFAVIRNIKL
jgi:hypothetical protein